MDKYYSFNTVFASVNSVILSDAKLCNGNYVQEIRGFIYNVFMQE